MGHHGDRTSFMLAGGSLRKDVQLRRKLPDVYYLKKPWQLDELLGAVRRVLTLTLPPTGCRSHSAG